jgi:hypothetical protein
MSEFKHEFEGVMYYGILVEKDEDIEPPERYEGESEHQWARRNKHHPYFVPSKKDVEDSNMIGMPMFHEHGGDKIGIIARYIFTDYRGNKCNLRINAMMTKEGYALAKKLGHLSATFGLNRKSDKMTMLECSIVIFL